MDGNGRWAKARGLPRFEGHRRGVEAVRRAVRAAIDLGIAISRSIVSRRRTGAARRRGRDADGAPEALYPQRSRRSPPQRGAGPGDRRARKPLAATSPLFSTRREERTAGNRGLTLIVAFNYGGATGDRRGGAPPGGRGGRRAHRSAKRSTSPLSPPGSTPPAFPTPISIIRTSGEQRLSNFLLWQAAYSELVFPAYPLAGFRRGGVRRRIGAICGEGAPVRRRRRASPRQVGFLRDAAW